MSKLKLHLLGVGQDAKTVKGEKFGWLTAILYLAPAREAGRGNVCINASVGCLASCLFTSGNAGMFKSVNEARIRKTQLFFDNKEEFMRLLREDIRKFIAYAEKQGKRACVRLNGTSDIAWERVGIMSEFPDTPFYDYTKSSIRASQFARGVVPSNYHLTFSRSESNEAQTLDVLRNGGNVAVVFAKGLPQTWQGFEVIDGDLSDLRFLDKRNVIVGLKAKGKARKDTSGFVVANA